MANNFKERIDEILIKKDFDFYGSGSSVERVMDVLDKYGVDNEVLLSGLERIENIRYGRTEELDNEHNARVIDKKFLMFDLPDMSEVIIIHQGGYDFRTDTNIESVQLTRGLVDALSAREENNENVMGINGSLNSLSWCVRDQIVEDVFPEMSDKFVFEGVKYRLTDKYFDILMEVDGNNLVSNYFNTSDEFKNDPNVRDLNQAIEDLQLKVSNGKENIPEGDKIYFEGREDCFFSKDDIDKLNSAYCQYVGLKLKELSVDEAEILKGQVMSLPGMTDEHLKILENPKEIDKAELFENNIKQVLDSNSISDEREVEAITQALLKIREYGVDEDHLLNQLSKLKDINYVSTEDLESVFLGRNNVEFNNEKLRYGQDALHHSGTGKVADVDINVGVDNNNAEDLMKNKYFVSGIVDVMSIKPGYEFNHVGQSEMVFRTGIEQDYSAVGKYIKEYMMNDILKDNAIDITKNEADALKIDVSEDKLKKCFDVLLDNDSSLIRKYLTNEELSPKGKEFLDAANNFITNHDNASESDFNKAYCRYLGECSKDLSKDEFEFLKNRVDSLPGITKEDLDVMNKSRSSAIFNDNSNDLSDEKAKVITNDVEFD